LQDIRSNQNPFSGITVVFGGDFQQTLPIIPKGSCEDILLAMIQWSLLWQHITLLRLKQNMCLDNDASSVSFAKWLLDIGHRNGCLPMDQNKPLSMRIPNHMLCQDEEDLIDSIYGSINDRVMSPSPDYFYERVILAPLNDSVRLLNATVLECLRGEQRVYDSADCQTAENGVQQQMHDLPIKFLHSLNASGLPIAHLNLQLGCSIIILRNLDAKHGLCNGTQATILHMSNRVLEVHLIGGDHNGEIAMIPHITLSPSLTGIDFAINLKRRQFLFSWHLQ
jgi:PIF1-like helicase